MDDVRWLIARELPRLRRYARALRGDAGADDLVQDCVERALRKHALWRRGTNIRAWLFRMLYNIHLSALRRGGRMPHFVPYDELAAPAANADASAGLELSEAARALEELPPEQRDVVLLVALEGLRYDEVAQVLGIAIGTVRSRLSRGRSALRGALAGRVGVAVKGAPRLRRVK